MFCLISPVAKTPAWFLEGQFIDLLAVYEAVKIYNKLKQCILALGKRVLYLEFSYKDG